MNEKAQYIPLKEIKKSSQYHKLRERQLRRGSSMVVRDYTDFQDLAYFLLRQKVDDTWCRNVIKEIETDLIGQGKLEGVLYIRKTVREGNKY